MPAKPAIFFEDQSITWRELWESTQRAAGYLEEHLNNQNQAVVAVLLPNSIDFVITYLAILYSGHITLPLDPAFKSLELDAIIEQIQPKLLLSDKDYIKQLSPAHRRQTILTKELFKHQPPAKAPLRLDPNKQIASLTFTSGTTGRPKAAPNTHSNHIWNIKVCSSIWDWTAKDTLLVAVPLSHMLGIVMGLSGALYHGNTIYLHRWFEENEVLNALASGKISFFSHAASAYLKLLQTPGDYDLSSVRLCVSGAAPLAPAVWRELKVRFGIEVLETYGTTETGRIAGNRLNERILGSPGRPLPDVKLRLSPEGEIEIKSPGVFPGYFNNPSATAVGRTADGYWRTGDLAQLRGGYVYLKGRRQERIRRFGYTISPRDVEWAMQQNPAVKDIYVMGLQRPSQPNDELIYFIVTDLTNDEIQTYTKANLLFAWRPDRIIRLDDLPRTPSGKPSLGHLKELAAR